MVEITATEIKKTVSTYIAEFQGSEKEDIELKILNVRREDSNIIVEGVYSIGFFDDWHSFTMTFDERLNPIQIKLPPDSE